MVLYATCTRRLAASSLAHQSPLLVRQLRLDATLEAIRKASEEKTPNLVLYKYPSFSGAYGALFAHLYHCRLNSPCLILPFSAVVPFNIDDLCIEGMKTCYLLDFLGPKGFALELSRITSSMVFGFDHRKSVLSQISAREDSDPNLQFHVNIEKSSSTAVYEYFSAKLLETRLDQGDSISLLSHEEQQRIQMILEYIEAGDLRQWNLPNIKAFNIGLRKWRSKLNCITNPLMYQQLTDICSTDLIIKGNTYLSNRHTDASKLLDKVFRVKLGRGFYGECLGVRADGNPDLSDEMGKELSKMSVAAGLRPIGAVVYMQRKNLKMCLRSVDSNTDTSEIAKVFQDSASSSFSLNNPIIMMMVYLKAYGGGGLRSSSSFIIRMDESNNWLSGIP